MIADTAGKISALQEGGRRLALIIERLAKAAAPGVTGRDLETNALDLAEEYEATLSFLGYRGYPAGICVSVNDCVVHGLPDDRPFKLGDLVSIDVGIRYPKQGGYFTDSATTLVVGGAPTAAIDNLIKTTQAALKAAIGVTRAGVTTGDIGAAAQAVIERAGLTVITHLVGHGVGGAVHEKPQVPNFGPAGSGEVLFENQVIAIEPMVTMGKDKVRLGSDGFSYLTGDGALAAHFEHTVIVGRAGAQILTRT